MQDTRRFAKLRRALGLRATICRFLIGALVFSLLIPLADCKVKKTVRLDPSVVKEPEREKIVTATDSTTMRYHIRCPSGAGKANEYRKMGRATVSLRGSTPSRLGACGTEKFT